jgi:hypothetical protein
MTLTITAVLKQLPLLRRWRRPAPPRRVVRAKRMVIGFFGTLLAINLVMSIGMDTWARRLRDAEYFEHERRAIARHAIARGSQRESVVVFGSSRIAMGIRPLAVETDSDPVIANMGLIGSGGMLQSLAFDRLMQSGLRPDRVVIEFWPPMNNRVFRYSEIYRTDPHRLLPTDEAWIRDLMPNPEETFRLMREIRRTPIWCDRLRLMSHVLPSWLPFEKRFDVYWTPLDVAGWLPGQVVVDDSRRAEAIAGSEKEFRPNLAQFEMEPKAIVGMMRIINRCRAEGIAIEVIWMPEGSHLRSFYTEAVRQECERLMHCLGVPVIDARTWLPDTAFADDFHLTQSGASAFTRQFLDHIAK